MKSATDASSSTTRILPLSAGRLVLRAVAVASAESGARSSSAGRKTRKAAPSPGHPAQ